ncbi:MAG: PEP-CTERM sorting domain-containing protein [Spirulinaceae cyanobacterium]
MRQTIRIPKEMGQIKDKPLFKAILPLASGDYRWDHLGLSGSSNYNEKLSRDAKYHISLNVVSESEPEPIPEPTVFWGLVAIAGLGLTLRRSPQHP